MLKLTQIIFAVAALATATFTIGGDMGFLSKKEVVLFTGMKGTMTYKGQPAANAKIIRTEYWTSQEGDNETFYTDELGNFDLPTKRATTRILGDLQINQRIKVEYNGETFNIWGKPKQNPYEYGELGGKPVNVSCELTDPVKRIEQVVFIPTFLGTNCKWDELVEVEPLETILMDYYKARQ